MTSKEEIKEEKEGDEHIFKLIVDGKIVCVARTLPYSFLGDIRTTLGEEGKGYAKKLLAYLEKIAEKHNAKNMETTDIDPSNYRIVSLLKSMGYRFEPIEGDKHFIKATKELDEPSETKEYLERKASIWIDKNPALSYKYAE